MDMNNQQPMYIIQRDKKGWLQNKSGDVLVVDTARNENIWVPNNTITFNECARPIIRNIVGDESNGNDEIVELGVISVSENNTQQSDDIMVNETHEEESRSEGRIMWSHNATLSLIAAVEAHYEDMFHVKKKKNFWQVINQELISQHIEYSELACKKKWANLLRTYKATKDNKKKTGRGPNRFLFFDQLDGILGNAPTNASPHSIDVSLENSNDTETTESDGALSSTVNEGRGKKRKNPTEEYVRFKKQYYEAKEKRQEEKRLEARRLAEEHLKLQQEKLRILKEKNKIEERKVAALEKLANLTNT